jgi:hypothetical protein
VGLDALDQLLDAEEGRRRTLLAEVEGDELLERATAEAERVTGGFDRLDSVLLLVLPAATLGGCTKFSPNLAENNCLVPCVPSGWSSAIRW